MKELRDIIIENQKDYDLTEDVAWTASVYLQNILFDYLLEMKSENEELQSDILKRINEKKVDAIMNFSPIITSIIDISEDIYRENKGESDGE